MQQLELFPDFIKEQQKMADDAYEKRREEGRLKNIKKAKANGQPVYVLDYLDEGYDADVQSYECTHYAISQAYDEMIGEQAILCEFDTFLQDVKEGEYMHFDFSVYDIPYELQ